MTATTMILTSYTGMHYHLPSLYLPEEKQEWMDRFLARSEPNTLAEALDQAINFSGLLLETDCNRLRDDVQFASQGWNCRLSEVAFRRSQECVAGTWTDALEDAIQKHGYLHDPFEVMCWKNGNHNLWRQHKRLRPGLLKAGIDLSERLTFTDLITSGCLRKGELPGLLDACDFDDRDYGGQWGDFREAPHDPNQILFQVSVKNYC